MRVYSPCPDFTLLYYINDFTKRQIIRRFWGKSVLQLEMPMDYDAVGFLQKNCWIVDDNYEPFIIRNIAQDETNVTITAYSAHWGFEGRITIPPVNEYAIEKTGSADVVVKEFINQTLNRNSNTGLNITTAAIQSLGDSISDQTRYKNLGDEIVRILNAAGRGEKFTFKGDRIEFDTYPGEDRSENCIFDVRYKNIEEYEYTLDATSTQTTPIVGGAGEGIARQIKILGDTEKSWERREVFVDARDIAYDNDEKLEERGKQAIISEEKKYTTKVMPNSNLVYNEDYHLGDFISINVPIKTYKEVDGYFEPETNIVRMKTRIIEVIETCEQGAETIELTVGDNVIKSETTQIKNEVAQLKSVENAFPPGFIMMYSGDTAPAGYLIANGAEINRTTYSELFNVIGTKYGSGDGTSTFNLPDLRSKVAVGLSSDIEFNSLGKIGGEKKHTLTVSEMPSHRHDWDGVNDGAATTNSSGTYPFRIYQDKSANWNGTATFMHVAGGDATHNNLQPYITLNYIIKY